MNHHFYQYTFVSHFRRSDAKHNRHHGCFFSCARQSDLLNPPPPQVPSNKDGNQNTPLPRDNKIKTAPTRRHIGGLMPSTTAIKGCYSSCAWRSDPLTPPPRPPSQVITNDNQQKSYPHPRLGQSLSRKWEHYI